MRAPVRQPIDPSLLLQEMTGDPAWGEAVLYAVMMGALVGCGPRCEPVRIGWNEYSNYTSELMTLEEDFRLDPGRKARRHANLGAIAGIMSHEGFHHYLDNHPGRCRAWANEVHRSIGLQTRHVLLTQLDVHCLIRESKASTFDLERHWVVTPGYLVHQKREQAVEHGETQDASPEAMRQAKREAMEDFASQVAACLGRLRLRHGPDFLAQLWDTLIKEKVLPRKLPSLLEYLRAFSLRPDLEAEALRTSLHYLGQDESSPWSRRRARGVKSGAWPADLRRGLALIPAC
jgi:hypothetical protein